MANYTSTVGLDLLFLGEGISLPDLEEIFPLLPTNLKELIDALVVVGWFVDDGPKYISEVRFRQRADNPRPVNSTTIVEVIQ